MTKCWIRKSRYINRFTCQNIWFCDNGKYMKDDYWTSNFKNWHSGFVDATEEKHQVHFLTAYNLTNIWSITAILNALSCCEEPKKRLPFKQMCSEPWREHITRICGFEIYASSPLIIKSCVLKFYIVSLSSLSKRGGRVTVKQPLILLIYN